jgi:hypothetical protein
MLLIVVNWLAVSHHQGFRQRLHGRSRGVPEFDGDSGAKMIEHDPGTLARGIFAGAEINRWAQYSMESARVNAGTQCLARAGSVLV